MMEILVNGERQNVPVGCTVSDLLSSKKLDPRFLAVERNQQIVPRNQHPACVLQPDDELEIVTLVGGG